MKRREMFRFRNYIANGFFFFSKSYHKTQNIWLLSSGSLTSSFTALIQRIRLAGRLQVTVAGLCAKEVNFL